jgi:hypothetical protein
LLPVLSKATQVERILLFLLLVICCCFSTAWGIWIMHFEQEVMLERRGCHVIPAELRRKLEQLLSVLNAFLFGKAD